MNAKEFLETKGVFNLDTKKRYNEVVGWMEEYAALRQPPVISSVCGKCEGHLDIDSLGRYCTNCEKYVD